MQLEKKNLFARQVIQILKFFFVPLPASRVELSHSATLIRLKKKTQSLSLTGHPYHHPNLWIIGAGEREEREECVITGLTCADPD